MHAPGDVVHRPPVATYMENEQLVIAVEVGGEVSAQLSSGLVGVHDPHRFKHPLCVGPISAQRSMQRRVVPSGLGSSEVIGNE